MKKEKNGHNKLFLVNKTLGLFLVILCVFIASCQWENNSFSIDESEFSSLEENFSFEASLDNDVSEEYISVEVSDEDIYKEISELLDGNIDHNNIKYVADCTLSTDTELFNLYTVYDNNEELGFFSSSLSSPLLENEPAGVSDFENNNTLWASSAVYNNGFCYLDDDYLGKISFPASSERFCEIISDDFFYYEFLTYGYEFNLVENNVYEYQFEEGIVDSPLVLKMFSCIDYGELTFDGGSLQIDLRDGNNILSNGNIHISYSLDGSVYEAVIQLNITCCLSDYFLDIDTENYSVYQSERDYILSSALYNLVLNNSLELSTEARIYSDVEKNIFSDINCITQSNLSSDLPELFYEMTLENSESAKFQRYIYDSLITDNILVDDNTLSTTTPIIDPCKVVRDNTLEFWGLLPFNILSFENFEITEDDTYYVVQYKYNQSFAVDIFNNFLKIYNYGFAETFPIIANGLKCVSSEGTAVIRKSDNILIEQSCKILLEDDASVEKQIIISSEVLSINRKIIISKP